MNEPKYFSDDFVQWIKDNYIGWYMRGIMLNIVLEAFKEAEINESVKEKEQTSGGKDE